MNGISTGKAIALIIALPKRGGSGGGILVGYVDQTSFGLPTTRPDGTAIKDQDYVYPSSSAVFPFTLGGITFTNRFGKGVYYQGSWRYEEGLVPRTDEVTVKNINLESVNGSESTAKVQSDINTENVEEFKNKRRTDVAQNKWWYKKYSFESASIKNLDGKLVSSGEDFLKAIDDIMSDPDSLPEDKTVPFTQNISCLVKSIDLESDEIVLDSYCYGTGKRVVVGKYTDEEGDLRYRVYEADPFVPVPNKYVQRVQQEEWTIEHNLLKFPSIQAKSQDDEIILPQSIEYIDLKTVKLIFSRPVRGYAVLN